MLELTLRSTVILAAAWLLARALPRATAATRHLLWHSTLVAVLAAPLLLPIVPRLPLLPPPPAQQVQAVQAVQEGQEVQPGVGATAPIEFPLARTLGTLGTLGCACWFACAWLFTWVKVRRAAPAPVQWQLEVNALCQKLRIKPEVRVRVVAGSSSPLAAGLLRPTVLLPQIAAAWTVDRRRAVLLHELAHVRRHDCRVQLVAQAACALYWFNPLVWIAASQLRLERERACDDEVLRNGAQPSSYATHLLDIARELRPSLGPSAALAMARRCEIEGRLLAVLADKRRTPFFVTRWAIASVLGITTVVALGAASPPRLEPRWPERGNASSLWRDAYMAGMPQSKAIAPLQKALDDPSQDVREKAAMSLSLLSGADVVPALLQALADRDSQVREKAAIGLALRRDARVIDPLIAAMQDPDSQVREKVAIALGTSGDRRARVPLVNALRDRDSQVREKAAAALILLER